MLSLPATVFGQSEEFRGFWADAFHAGFKNASEVTALINNVRAANANAVVVELRKRGDAYYTPDFSYVDFEPHATDTSPANFDSLADLVAKAHDTTGGKPRIEVHVWLVTWPIWSSSSSFPTDPQHPFNRHPEWLTQDNLGATWNGSQYCFDPGHPGALNHTYRIAMNLVTNYDLDGLNFDYVRYAGNTWGYNPTAVARFHARYGGFGNPSPADSNWLQFRRDQVTALVRRVYLNTVANKPRVKISADTITWAPGPANLAAWYSSSAAWNNVLQDWRGWMQEGILDLNIPMAYFDQSGAYTRDWTNWCNFIRDYQYGRHSSIGPGLYLNSVSNAIAQMRYTRALSPAGHRAQGLCGYSYPVPNNAGIGFSTFHTYLTNSPNPYDSIAPALFSQRASVPAMPWKSTPTSGHLMGTAFLFDTNHPLDGVSITVSGPVTRSQTSDGLGFFGFVDLPAGTYQLRATWGAAAANNSVSISTGLVTTSNLLLSTNDLTLPTITLQPQSRAAVPGSIASFSVTASGPGPLRYQWRFNGQGLSNETNATLVLPSVAPGDFGFYLVDVSNSGGTATSDPASLTPANPPAILQPQSAAGSFTFQFATEFGPAYAIEWATNLAAGNAWQFLVDYPGLGSLAYVTNTAAPGGNRFYRIRVH